MLEYKPLGKTREKVSVIGMGTWGIGGYSTPNYSRDEEDVMALRRGIELDMTLIDTAEMYAAGHSEEVVGKAIHGLRDRVFLATKVWPDHLQYHEVLKSAEASLKRLGTRYTDLYQIHWPNPSVPIAETMRALERLVDEGKVRHIGVSNFSSHLMDEAMKALSKYELVSNQVEYSLIRRDIEKELLPFCELSGVTVIAYSPLARGRIPGDRVKVLLQLASRYGRSVAQIALNWLIISQAS